MKITQYFQDEQLRLGLVEGQSILPIDFKGSMIDFIVTGAVARRSSEQPLSFQQVRFAPVITQPSKIVVIGLNYLDHVRESKGKMPKVPIVLAKFPSSLIGHEASITWSEEVTRKVDFEAELAIIIGQKAFRTREDEVMNVVYGYTCANDVSARDLQFGDSQWVRSKSLDTFCPLGPWIVTRDEIPNPHALSIRCLVNGTIMQDSNTEMMIFKLPELISFLSHHFTLFPGDVILTGTPHGVGAFREPSIYLKDRDEVVVEIEKIGRLRNTCRVKA